MDRLYIRGGGPLRGEIAIQGAKNSVLPILAASLLANGPVELLRCPRLRDVEISIRILRELGCNARWEHDNLIINAADMNNWRVSDELMREMRSSVIFLGAILARRGKAVCSMPGGCELGPRPIDLHISGLRAMGAEIAEHGGELRCEAVKLTGREILLATPSVGATENLMLAACGASGITSISNAAREPEITDLQNFLNACGARIRGAGSDIIMINGGVMPLHGCTYRVMPDRIAAATYLCAAAASKGEIFLRGAREKDLYAVISRLRECGCEISPDAAGIRCIATKRLRAPLEPIKTAPYPGFPTDAQSVFMSAVLKADGCTVLEENLFENRYRHVDELRRMGADIRVSGRAAAVRGVENLRAASVECTDLRGGAALCIAALAAEGISSVGSLRHIDRGYENICRDLSALGAEISRTDTTRADREI